MSETTEPAASSADPPADSPTVDSADPGAATTAATPVTQASADEPVPKLPRGRGMRFSGPEMFRIGLTLAMLVAVIALTKPCSHAVSTFVMGMDGSNKGSAMPKPGNVDMPQGSGSALVDPYEHLTPGMSEDQIKAAIDRAKAKGSANGIVPSTNGSANPASATRSNANGSNANGSNVVAPDRAPASDRGSNVVPPPAPATIPAQVAPPSAGVP